MLLMLPLSENVKTFNKNINIHKLPEEILHIIHEMNDYSPRIYPPFKGCNIQYNYYHKLIDNSYATLVIALQNIQYDGVIIIPRIRTGGTDKLLKSYLSVLTKDIKLNILIICEDSSPSKWTYLFHDMAKVIYLDKLYHSDIPKQVQITALHMAIGIIKPKFIWGFNSRLACILFSTHGESLRQITNIWFVMFAHWIHEVSYREFGFIHDYLPKMKDYITYMISDNRYFIEKIIKQYNIPNDKLVYMPSANSVEPLIFYPRIKRKKLRLLWASGIEWNKGIDILVLIAEQLNKNNILVEIDIYGTPKNHEGFKLLDKLRKNISTIKTVTYKGEFSNFNLLNPQEYDGFLFTSIIEGMPNILLEATEHQMFIISSLVGGVGDLIKDNTTGILIQDCFDVQSYVQAIEFLRDMSDESYNEIRQNLVNHYNTQYISEVVKSKFLEIINKN